MNTSIEIDIIIASYAQNDHLKGTTLNAIYSLMASEDPEYIKFNLIVLESEQSIAPYQYPHSKTIYPEKPFGYHRYMNIGIRMTCAAFICICNNDLVFHSGWASEILKPFYQYSYVSSASPFCSIHHTKIGLKASDGMLVGARIRKELAGWCIFFKRDLLRYIGMLDENYIFWCADNDYANTLAVLGYTHVLVTGSIVDHLESKTLTNQTEERQEELTYKETDYFIKKWYPKIGEGWKEID